MIGQGILIAMALLAQEKPGAGAANAWHTFSPESNAFQVRLPGKPTERLRMVKLMGKKVELAGYSVARRTYIYGVTVGELAEAPADPRPVLKELRDDAVKQAKGALRDESPINWNGHPGRAVVIDVPKNAFPGGATATVHVYLVGKQVYQVTALMSNALGKVDTEPFFASFEPRLVPKGGVASSPSRPSASSP